MINRGAAPPIRVMVIDDHRGIAESIVVHLNGAPGFAAVGFFASVDEAISSGKVDRTDVVVLDASLNGDPDLRV